jgi:hypothetical protein
MEERVSLYSVFLLPPVHDSRGNNKMKRLIVVQTGIFPNILPILNS